MKAPIKRACWGGRTRLLLLVVAFYVAPATHLVDAAAGELGGHMSRRSAHPRRLAASNSSGATDGSGHTAARPGRHWLAAAGSPPMYEYWVLPPPSAAEDRVPTQSITSYDTSQAVVFQVVQHFDDLTAGMDLEDDGSKAPATGGKDIPPQVPATWSQTDTTLQVREGRVAYLTCVLPGATIAAIIWPVYGQLQAGCNSTLSYSIVSAACLGLHSCAVFATNGVFGDPCPGASKSLTFTYRWGVPLLPVTALPRPHPHFLQPPPSPPSPSPLPPSPPLPSQDWENIQSQPRLTTPISPGLPAMDVSFPPTVLLRAPASLPPGCPLSMRSVHNYGARGDSFTNDAAALRQADAAATGPLYFPVGVYRISTSLTLTKPVLMGAATRFYVDGGMTLRLMAQPRRAPLRSDPMFAGPGKVVFGKAGLEVFPQWWWGPDRSQSAALQAAADSCELPCTLLQTNALNLDQGVALNPRNGFFGNAKALLVGTGTGEGITLLPGSYTMPLSFTGILNFAKWGLRLLPGVSDVNIQAGFVTNNGEGLVLAASPTQPLTNVTVSHISVSQNNQFSTVIYSSADKSLFQDVNVRINFELMGGSKQPKSPSAGTVFRGGLPTLRNTRVTIQAMDPAQFLVTTKWVAVRTETSRPVKNFLFRSDCWNGGFEKEGGLVNGSFRNSYFMVYTSGSMNGRVFNFSSSSSNNTLSMGNNAAAGEWALATKVDSLSTFNGGKPVVEQGLWVSTKTTRDWYPKEQRTFYLYTYFAQAANSATKMHCIPWQGWNPAVSCDSVQRAVTSAPSSNNQIAVTLSNKSNKVIPAGFFHRFGVQVAP